MVDTHCHLDQYRNPIAVARAAAKAGITVIAMTGLPSHYASGLDHIGALRTTRLALGLHPLLATYHRDEWKKFESYLQTTSYVGEVGLDFSRHGKDTRKIQLDSFRRLLSRLESERKFVSLHSRGAEQETLDLLREYGMRYAVFHWYSGSGAVADAIASDGYFFSVNPAMLRSASGRAIIKRLPRTLILTETDGPYIDVDGRPAAPTDIPAIVANLAILWNIRVDVAHAQISTNLRSALSHLRD